MLTMTSFDEVLTLTDAISVEKVAHELCAGTIDSAAWVDTAREAWDDLPSSLRRAVRRFRRHSGPRGALLLRGLPVDETALPRTPTVDGSVQRVATTPAAVLMLLACGLGDPIAYRREKSGALVQDVVPVPGKENFQGNAGSVMLSFHTENAFHPYRPDYVALLCLRPDHDRQAELRTACIREVSLPCDTKEVLFSAEFRTDPPPSFGGGDSTAPHPVLTGSWDDPDLRVDLSATAPLTARAASALASLQEHLTLAVRTVRLVPGDLAIVDNRVTVHGRSEFTPRYDGRDRWLQRTFVATDLRRSRGCRPYDGYVVED
ncbi:L-asparagine oxygenase [Lentzea sp. NBRC 105346]|uniref:TauD/TfdA family dioxygenase n=1 Tax=Lentzea sp. NBRC 105346 TaxID=3032205 RepID=UPI0024A18297|nr:TauD/TfdA family dioxygenase [Lentzea sp. NBRC 105346]GLZ29183.1 L-asparagine oxygenase [Lentzea sp. NBRC 105346]